MLKQKIVQNIYFLLILIASTFYEGIIIYDSFSNDIEVVSDGDFEGSQEDLTFDSDTIDGEEVEAFADFDFDISFLNICSTNFSSTYFFLNVYNICLEQKTPPP
jgi:hypothetical protein